MQWNLKFVPVQVLSMKKASMISFYNKFTLEASIKGFHLLHQFFFEVFLSFQ
jgi:hypothetical protein